MSSHRLYQRRGVAVPENTKKDGIHYLRVSSVRQTHTAVDIDRDGNSIATQREECDRKAAEKQVNVIQEFVEPGKSAQTIEKRPEFRKLLAFLAENPNVGYVFVYSRSRAFRNVEEAILTRKHLRGLGVKIISTKEDFGDSLEAEFMEVISDTMNDLQNKRSGEDIKMKMAHKAKNGGTISRAPIGYLNARIDVGDGKQVNTVVVDEARAPLVRLAFELYATGHYTMESLQEAMEDHGLRARPAGRWKAERIISKNSLARILTDPYYTGDVSYQGQLYEGRHPEIVDHQLFEQVQQIYEKRSTRGNRDRQLKHYLKGQLRCERCHKRDGAQTRLIYTEARGRSGDKYGYFMCRGRQIKNDDGKPLCDLPYLQVGLVEEKIESIYRALTVTTVFADEFDGVLKDAIVNHDGTTRAMRRSMKSELQKLDEREKNLVDAIMDATLPKDVVRQKMADIRHARESIAVRIGDLDDDLKTGANILASATKLTVDIADLYNKTTDDVRTQLNQVFFKALYLDAHREPDQAIVNDPFLTILDLHREWAVIEAKAGIVQGSNERTRKGQKYASVPKALLAWDDRNRSTEPRDVQDVIGSSRAVLVDAKGLEPLTSRV